MHYEKIFDPPRTQVFLDAPTDGASKTRAASVYVYTDEIVLAVNVALATGRPLLVRGPSGCGKSTLARNVARTLGRRFYERVISSRTQARDLLWEVDLLRRLQDAQSENLAPDFFPYVTPGVLWWAFDRGGALAQAQRSRAGDEVVRDPGERDANATDADRAVVLLDEIDKADPDVPNNLLVPIGSLSFRVEETGELVDATHTPLIFITTNDERELPPAFLRRCVELRIDSPTADQLSVVGETHFRSAPPALLGTISRIVIGTGNVAESSAVSTAEYLDTVRACLELNVDPDSELFESLARVTVWKHGRARRTPS